jgi:hypothetical protein
MNQELSPKQALFLWKMITAQTPEDREPKLGNATPKLDAKKERQPLLDQGYLTIEKRGAAGHLILTNKAWAWAEKTHDVELMQSNSKIGAVALQGLLHKLLPFLQEHELPLASLFSARQNTSVASRVEHACLELTGGQRQQRVRLSALRQALPDVPRPSLDQTLLELQDAGRAVLYRDDNSAGLKEADHQAALLVGGAPRHIIYLEA